MASTLLAVSLLSVAGGSLFPHPAIASRLLADLPIQTTIDTAQATPAKPPESVISALRRAISQQTAIPPKKLRVVEATAKTWANGCLEMPKTDEMCTQMLVQGWRVTLTNGTRRWVYRTDATGRVYRLETSTKQSSLWEKWFGEKSDGSNPGRIPANELPSALPKDVIFRAIASGGFAGQTYETTLTKDGKLTRSRIFPNGTPSQAQVRQLSAQEFTEFQQLLKQHRLKQFDRMNYPAAPGSADFFTVTLSGQGGTVRYADTIQEQLPASLKAIIQAWSTIAHFS